MVPKTIPEATWFEDQRSLLADYFDATPWQEGGERKLKTMGSSLRKYANKLSQLPENFVSIAMDQYLASLWHESFHYDPDMGAGLIKAGKENNLRAIARFAEQKWPYRTFEVLKDLGEGRYWCRDETEVEFGLYSGGLGHVVADGGRLFLSVVMEVGEFWHMTYGPILGWNGLFPGDLQFFASKVARQLYEKEGFSAVVHFNPVPFWGAWYYGVKPAVYHRDEPVIQCWLHGRLDPGIDEALPSTWRRDDVGSKTRWMYRDENFFRRRQIFLDRKTGEALVLARRPGDFNKTMKLLGRRFEQDEPRPMSASLLMLLIVKDILDADDGVLSWERPFDRFDKTS